jgi:hypothetical protein
LVVDFPFIYIWEYFLFKCYFLFSCPLSSLAPEKIEHNIGHKRCFDFPREQIFLSKIRQPKFSELEKFANRAGNQNLEKLGNLLGKLALATQFLF